MAILMIKRNSVTNVNPDKDRRGCYKRGYVVSIKPDGWDEQTNWNDSDYPPSKGKFVYIKIPGVAVDNTTLLKYVQYQLEDVPNEFGEFPIYRRRLWQIRWDDLPALAKDKLANIGYLTIKVGTYSGEYDYTWPQVKSYFRNLKTGTNETENI